MSPRIPIPPDLPLGKDMVNCLMNWTSVVWTPGTPKLADAACQPLAKYHDMFLLDPVELGYTHSTEHVIKVMDNNLFKEKFRWIPPTVG